MTAVTEADVIVVGGGGSGLAAAAEAARLGRSVILLEKDARTGGTTSWSVGSVTATNTPHQKRAGIQDSPEAHFEDLALHAGALAPRDNLALRRILVENTSKKDETVVLHERARGGLERIDVRAVAIQALRDAVGYETPIIMTVFSPLCEAMNFAESRELFFEQFHELAARMLETPST